MFDLSIAQTLVLTVVAIVTVAGLCVFGLGHYLDIRDLRLGINARG